MLSQHRSQILFARPSPAGVSLPAGGVTIVGAALVLTGTGAETPRGALALVPAASARGVAVA